MTFLWGFWRTLKKHCLLKALISQNIANEEQGCCGISVGQYFASSLPILTKSVVLLCRTLQPRCSRGVVM